MQLINLTMASDQYGVSTDTKVPDIGVGIVTNKVKLVSPYLTPHTFQNLNQATIQQLLGETNQVQNWTQNCQSSHLKYQKKCFLAHRCGVVSSLSLGLLPEAWELVLCRISGSPNTALFWTEISDIAPDISWSHQPQPLLAPLLSSHLTSFPALPSTLGSSQASRVPSS